MKTRIVHTRFWEDSFVCELSHKEKLLFLYLLTNSRIGLTGIYELPDKFIVFNLNLSKEELKVSKKKLQDEGKIYFRSGYIAIKNITKYNDYSKGNENQKNAFNRELELLPDNIKKYLCDNNFHLVINYLSTSRGLVTQLDINKKSEIRNNKLETINRKLDETKKVLYEKMKWKQNG